jgi:UDP-N-acetyl-D-galactosamine dehydrogenase
LSVIDDKNPVDSLIVAVGHHEYRALGCETLKNYCRWSSRPVFADLKSLYSAKDLADVGFSVFRL